MIDRIKLSKLMSFILRHHPDQFGLTLDPDGYLEIGALVKSITDRFTDLSEDDIIDIVNNSEKKRFEISGTKIRAMYGHSVDVTVTQTESEPPEVLYHGTERSSVQQILKDGLVPMGRQFVHLSVSQKDAYQVGSRRDPKPVILRIKAKDAYKKGIKFYKSGDLFLTRNVPPDFIKE
jgi:putative RNA 2'-phosphotransferase